MASSVLAKMAVEISANTAQFTAAMANSEKQLASFARGISNVANAVGVSFSAFAAVSVLQGAIKTISDFQHQMQIVKAITGATGKEFDDLKNSAVELGASTRYTATQVAELQTEFGRLGFNTDEILAATEATLSLATATGEDLAAAADVAGSTVRGFGLSANETGRVADVMAESLNRSALSMESFREAMKLVAPIAAQSSISLEETTALLGVLADAGIRGSQAGTSLRKIMTDIGDGSGTLSEKLQKLAAKGLTGADAMSEVGRTAYASLLILAENTKKTDDLTKSLENAAGAADKAAKIMGDDLTGDLVLLSSAYDGLILSFSEGSTTLRELTQALTNLLNFTTAMVKGQGELGKFFQSLADHIALPLKALGFFAKEITNVTDKVEDNAEKLRAIESTVQAAFDSGNIEAYIKALDQNIYKEEIIAEIRKRQGEAATKAAQAEVEKVTQSLSLIESLEKELKETEEKKKKAFSVEAISEFNVKIKELRDEIDLLNASGFESDFLKNLNKNQKLGIETELKLPEDKPLENLFPTTVPLDTENFLEGIAEMDKAAADFHVNQKTRANQQLATNEAIAAQQEKTNATAEQFGAVVGDAFGRAAAGQITFKQALKQTTGEILKLFLQRAMAGVIAGAAQTTLPPPVILALAAAGMAGISALFSSIGGPSGGGGGAGVSGPPRTNVSRVTPEPLGNTGPDRLEFVIHGEDLVTLSSSQAKKDERRKG